MNSGINILDFNRFRELARPTSVHLDEGDTFNFIQESQDVFILPAVGTYMFARMCRSLIQPNADRFATRLLKGGYWYYDCNENELITTDVDGIELLTSYPDAKFCHGIEKALAYYTYARMMRDDGAMVTRAGSIQHNDAYGTRLAQNEKHARYNDVMNAAELYLNSCLLFLAAIRKAEGDNTCCGEKTQIRGHRAHIHAIGK